MESWRVISGEYKPFLSFVCFEFRGGFTKKISNSYISIPVTGSIESVPDFKKVVYQVKTLSIIQSSNFGVSIYSCRRVGECRVLLHCSRFSQVNVFVNELLHLASFLINLINEMRRFRTLELRLLRIFRRKCLSNIISYFGI